MLLLMSDVCLHLWKQRFAVGESGISCLPRKVPYTFFAFKPFAAFYLDRLYETCEGFSGTKAYEHMDMVGRSIDSNRMMCAIFAGSCKIGVKFFLNVRTKKAFSVLYGKYDVKEYLRVSVSHIFKSPTYGRLHRGFDTSHCGHLSVALMAGYHIASRWDAHFRVFKSEGMLTLSSMRVRRSSMRTRVCSIVSRSRRVTVPSCKVSWSTVTQYGVPMAS